METTTCCISSDRLRIAAHDGVLAVTASGVIGLRECLGILTRARAAAVRSQAFAVQLDLRAAAVTLSQPEYVEVLRAAIAKPIQVPIAFVVGEAVMSFAWAHETLMRRRGLKRKLFSSPASAARWIGRLPRTPRSQDLLS